MRTLRAFLALSLVSGSFAATIAGCGGDDSSNPPDNTTPDSSSVKDGSNTNPPTDSSTQDATPAAPSAKATSVTLYIGNAAKLDGTASTGPSGLTYAWTVASAPAGSTIATGSLTGAATASVSFMPDKIGTYTLELSVSAPGAATSKTNATATVVDPPVFYYDSLTDAGVSSAKLLVQGATEQDAAAAKPVACFERDSGAYESTTLNTARGGTDWWEAPAGQPSKAAFVMQDLIDGGQAWALFTATSNGSCATPPTRLDTVPTPSDSSQHGFEQPRISPDGTRVAYVRQQPDGARVATIGLDGTGLRILAPRFADDSGAPNPDASTSFFIQSRPFWISTTHVGWVEAVSNDIWQVTRANDAASATREVIMKCTGVTPVQAAMVGNEVLVSQSLADNTQRLIVYAINAGTKACENPRILTPYTDGGAIFAGDFQVSPDGKEVAYQSSETPEGGATTVETKIARIDGTGTPRSVTSMVGSARGPRFVGSGAFVSWQIGAGGGVDAGIDGSASAIVLASTDGGGLKNVTAQSTNVQAIGNGSAFFGACSMGNAAGSGVAFFGIAAIAGLRLVRRRRR